MSLPPPKISYQKKNHLQCLVAMDFWTMKTPIPIRRKIGAFEAVPPFCITSTNTVGFSTPWLMTENHGNLKHGWVENRGPCVSVYTCGREWWICMQVTFLVNQDGQQKNMAALRLRVSTNQCLNGAIFALAGMVSLTGASEKGTLFEIRENVTFEPNPSFEWSFGLLLEGWNPK